MPSRSTVQTWVSRHPDVLDAVTLARQLAGWAADERRWGAQGELEPDGRG